MDALQPWLRGHCNAAVWICPERKTEMKTRNETPLRCMVGQMDTATTKGEFPLEKPKLCLVCLFVCLFFFRKFSATQIETCCHQHMLDPKFAKQIKINVKHT